MHRITIHHFGPIDFFNESVGSLNVLIGPQASGKSTISKLVFFFRSIRDDLLKLLLEDEVPARPLFHFGRALQWKFLGYFGKTKEMKDFRIVYYYSERKFITLTRKSTNGSLDINYSEEFIRQINAIFKNIREIKKQSLGKTVSETWNIAHWATQKKISDQSRLAINSVFEDSRTSIFVPAGRSLVSTISDHLEQVVYQSTDLLMKEFVGRLNALKKHFSKSLTELLEERVALAAEQVDVEKAERAIQIVERILKGRYVAAKDGEKIYYNSEDYVRLMYASSGQQEVMWILLLIFIMILEKMEVFIVIEEPEAHLYPVAQKEMVSLIALLLHESNNHVMITTHSPYILSALNIHLYAGRLHDLMEEKNAPIVDKYFRISPEGVKSFLLVDHGGGYEDIFDNELGMIKAEAIDRASTLINEEINRLIDLEVGE